MHLSRLVWCYDFISRFYFWDFILTEFGNEKIPRVLCKTWFIPLAWLFVYEQNGIQRFTIFNNLTIEISYTYVYYNKYNLIWLRYNTYIAGNRKLIFFYLIVEVKSSFSFSLSPRASLSSFWCGLWKEYFILLCIKVIFWKKNLNPRIMGRYSNFCISYLSK